jgi:hypothetical protein
MLAHVELEPVAATGPLSGMRVGARSASVDNRSTGSGGTDVRVHETAHRVYCGGACVTGPAEGGCEESAQEEGEEDSTGAWELCNVQSCFFLLFALALVGYGLVGGVMLAPYYPVLYALPLCLIALDLVAFALCACTDPGVVPPKPDLGAEAPPGNVRFCRKCNHVQEETTRHCSYCDACIRELDHHCGITGQCVGARNKVHFTALWHLYLVAFWSMVAGIVFSALCYVQSRAAGFDGVFSPMLDIAAKCATVLMALLLALALLLYPLAYFGALGGRCGDCLSRCLRPPMGRRGAPICSTAIPRVPICSRGPCSQLTVPERLFFPGISYERQG